MRVQILQHVAFEGPGTIAPFFLQQEPQPRIRITHLYAGELPLAPGEYDFLVVMGGPMSVQDEADHSWLVDEKRAIEAAIAAHRPVLGICLGAQLVASILGTEVSPMGYREIGWHPVKATSDWLASKNSTLLPADFTPLHWHGDSFDIPVGAMCIGSSEACANQGFVYGDRVWALQFHLEFDAGAVRRLSRAAAHELDGSTHVQSEAEMLAQSHRFNEAHDLMGDLLEHLSGLAGQPEDGKS